MLKKIFLGLVLLVFIISAANISDLNDNLLKYSRDGNIIKVIHALNNGADIESKDNRNLTALNWACILGYTKIVEILLSYNADIKTKCEDGYTPLHYATCNGREKIVKILLEHNADIYAKTIHDFTPLEWAEEFDSGRILNILKLFEKLKNEKYKNNIKEVLAKFDGLEATQTALVFMSNNGLDNYCNKDKELISFYKELNDVSNYLDCNKVSSLINKYLLIKDVLDSYKLDNFRKTAKDRLLLFNGLIKKYQMSPDIIYKITYEFLDN